MAATIDFFGGEGSTVAGGSVTVLSSTPPVGINSLAIVYVLARCPSTDDRAYWFQGLFANVTPLGVLTVDQRSDIIPAWSTNDIKHADIDFVISGGAIDLVVTGDPAGPDINWEAYVWRIRSPE